MQKLYFPAALLAVLCAGHGACRALPEHLKQPELSAADEVYEQKAATSVVGGFRTSLASLLFVKAHEYLHGGIIMRPMTDAEMMRGVRSASNGDQLKDHHGTETSGTPAHEDDSRGVWGHIERTTQPFMDIRHHGHRDLGEALPLFRMMTWSDPHFIEAYSMGAYLVFASAKDNNVKRALEFLQEGIKNNPRAWVLYKDYGSYHLYQLRLPKEGLSYLEKAVQIIEETPKDKVDEKGAYDAWTALVQSYRKMKIADRELLWARKGIKYFGAFATGQTTLRKRGLKE